MRDKNATSFSCEKGVITLYNKHKTVLAKIKIDHAVDILSEVLVACKKKLEKG